eukprot:3272517-Rhodomonas_salina.1
MRSLWEKEVEDIRIVHYTDVPKPWSCPVTSYLYPVCEWWINANRTPENHDAKTGCLPAVGCGGSDPGLAGVNEKYAGASLLVATILTSLSHVQYVEGCIALHVTLRRLHPEIPSVAFVVHNTKPELAAKYSSAVQRMKASGLQVVEIHGLTDAPSYSGGHTGTWIGQTTKFVLWQLTHIKRVFYMDNDVMLLGDIKPFLDRCKVGSDTDNKVWMCARKQDSKANREKWCSIYWQASAF